MNNPPGFSKLDVDRILRRAAEIDGSDDAGPVSVDEIRSIAREAGFDKRSIDLAIVEVQEAAVTVRRHPIQKTGIVIVHVSAVRTIPRDTSSDQLMTAVRLFQPYREGPAQVKLEEDQIRWRDRRGLDFSASSSAGVTEIRVMVSRVMVRRRRWIGWVKAAADQLEALVVLVANSGERGATLSVTGPRDQGEQARALPSP